MTGRGRLRVALVAVLLHACAQGAPVAVERQDQGLVALTAPSSTSPVDADGGSVVSFGEEQGEVSAGVADPAPPVSSTPPATAANATTAPPTTPATTAPATDTVPATDAPSSTTPPPTAAADPAIRPVTADELPGSWREGCPVPVEDLRMVAVQHLGFDGAVHTGTLVVHARWAEAVAGVFRTLLEAGFPIERVEPIDAYGGDDASSMAANNTSAFNCRTVAGTDRWSEHAYGLAIDVNPLFNPYVSGGNADPPGGAAYLERDPSVPGLITDGDVVVRAFAAIGWGWGGHWPSAKDYQHFSSTGR